MNEWYGLRLTDLILHRWLVADVKLSYTPTLA